MNTMIRATQKLDLSMMLLSRRQLRHEQTFVAGCLLADSSEQKHRSFMAIRIDMLVVPASLQPTERLKLSLGPLLQSQLLPLTSIGNGEGDTAHKIRAILHSVHLVVGYGEPFNRWRASIRGFAQIKVSSGASATHRMWRTHT